MNELNIHFEFFRGNSRNNWSWTSLMGPDKKKMLQHFPVSEFLSGICGVSALTQMKSVIWVTQKKNPDLARIDPD